LEISGQLRISKTKTLHTKFPSLPSVSKTKALVSRSVLTESVDTSNESSYIMYGPCPYGCPVSAADLSLSKEAVHVRWFCETDEVFQRHANKRRFSLSIIMLFLASQEEIDVSANQLPEKVLQNQKGA
jgi:hypothetical protein